MDLHRPKTKYTVGRGPLNDFVLDEERSGQIDWTHCTLLSDEDGNVRIVDNFTTNGRWVDFRRLAPGESCILQDGNSVRFGLCAISHCHPREYMSKAHARGLNHSYVFHSFTTKDPPGMPASDLELRSQLRELDRMRVDIIEERLRLDRQLRDNEERRRSITQSMRDIPPTKDADTLYAAQSRYDVCAQPLRSTYPHFFPLDVRDFRPQPWLLPNDQPHDGGTSTLYEMQRAFGALPNERPPPLEKNYAITEFTRALHRKDAPDWSHPEIIWGDLQSLDLSTPLNVPPSIIFWSIVHQLPVYMHPDYRVMSRQGPFAHPYACSEYVFSDESAAEYRAELGFPPLENAQPLRPMKALEVMEGRTITDEGYIAERVALLESNGELPLSPPTESLAPATSHESEELPLPAPTSSKRPRVSDVDLPPDGALALVGHSSRSTSPSSPLGSDSSARRRRAPVPDVHTRPSGTAADDVVTSNPTSDVTPRDPTPARAPKRPKTSHSPTPSPVACSAPTAGPEKVKHTLRSSPEVLSPAHESRAPATLSESPGAVTTTEPELKRSDAEAVEATDIGPGSPPSHSPAASPRS